MGPGAAAAAAAAAAAVAVLTSAVHGTVNGPTLGTTVHR